MSEEAAARLGVAVAVVESSVNEVVAVGCTILFLWKMTAISD